MNKKYTRTEIELNKLTLDKENPRFAELYNGSDKESDIIEYLLYTESAEEVAEAISEAEEFYDDRPLWVYKMDDGQFLVKDGNRRCAAVKALQTPNKYDLGLSRFEIKKLPVLQYHILADLDKRIRLEHNSNLFKKWGRIAKAIEIYRLFSSGSSIESLSDIDSNPRDFIKTATFYHKAVAIKGEDFKKLVREGRGKTGGKTIVFERLFKARKKCGYNFGRKTSEIIIKDNKLFESYINAIVAYLIQNPNTSSRTIDDIGAEKFLEKLKPFGFPPKKATSTSSNTESGQTNTSGTSQTNNSSTNNSTSNSGSNNTSDSGDDGGTSSNNGSSTNSGSSNNSGGSGSGRYSVKSKPTLKRKQIPSPLKKLIDECYNLDENNFANAKTALTRVTLECTLKFVVENTNKQNGNPIKTANHFDLAFKDRRGNPLPYTNFDTLKSKFTELVKDTGIRKAFENFDIQNPHQIIHNYRVAAVPANAKALCDNLIDLIEFMLQDETDLLNSIDLTKL
jgi:hypothetical protein|tara:strand:+ start:13254 stop:14777 length:1524 start_codon:yes stop_codon:yes gene_type:complete